MADFSRFWHDKRLVACVVLLLLSAGVASYSRISSQQDTAATAKQADRKATKAVSTTKTLSKAACANTRLFYRVLNALAQDSSPHFGSPLGEPVTPGARAKLIGDLYSSERKASAPLRKQGCDVQVPAG